MIENVITTSSIVTLHFALYLTGDELVDGNFDKAAATFTMGDGTLLPGFENKLLGLSVGAEESFQIAPVDGFGMPNPNNIQEFSRGQFSDMALEIGTVINFADAAKAELPGVVSGIAGDQVTVDFNHPLAGKELRFDVKIVEVINV